MKSLKLTLLLGAALAAMNVASFAGPDPGSQVFRPLSSKQELGALKPGTGLAHECPHCGTIATSKVGEDKSHTTGFSCPACKMKFTYTDTGGGKGPKVRRIECIDVATGKKMTARVCAAH